MLDISKTYSSNSYGDFIVISYVNCSNVGIEFIDTGHRANVDSANIKRGSIKDPLRPSVYCVGYFGVGTAISRSNGKNTKAYDAWNNMLMRCYDDECQNNHSTYKGCTVCDEWHNFQVFSSWFNENYVEGHEIDKDIKVSGNKVYSPITCLFVTKKDNLIKASAKSYRFVSPAGKVVDIYTLREFCRRNAYKHDP